MQDAVKAASFYWDQFGFVVKTIDSPPEFSAYTRTAATKTRYAAAGIPGTNLFWTFLEFNGVDRKAYTPRTPDPGAAAIGLQVRDIDAASAAVKAAVGSSISVGGSLKLGNGKVGFVRDPNGILVELAQP